MHLRTKNHRYAAAVPLHSAVLCVDCESVSSTRVDRCAVCGSRSVFSIAPMLGGTLLGPKPIRPEADGDVVRFNLDIRVALKDVEAKDVNAAVEGITEAIGLKLGKSRASLHIDVEPVVNTCTQEARAA